MRLSALKHVTGGKAVRELVEMEMDRTGGIFRLSPAWVARPMMLPGRRMKLADEYISQALSVTERWFASITCADNGAYNSLCPEDHGLSYIVAGDRRVSLRDAVQHAGDLLLGGRTWDVLPKFFDNRNRIGHHVHPCQEHLRQGLLSKPESYYFPPELNMNRCEFPATAMGIDSTYTDEQIRRYLNRYSKGDNRLTDLGNLINLIPGTGWFMPPCTFHAPGSLVTYEVQAASDVCCVPESRVNDSVMDRGLLDKDLPVTVAKEGEDAVFEHILSIARCRNSGNGENFRQQYFRPPVCIFEEEAGRQSFIVYRCGKASDGHNPDLFSAKKTGVVSGCSLDLRENAAFGAVILAGHGRMWVEGKEPVPIETASMFPTRDHIGGDEVFIAAGAAGRVKVECKSLEDLSIYQHFASSSNPEAGRIAIPDYEPFEAL